MKVRCQKCGEEVEAESKSEKGVDTSLIAHLFDTMDSWDIAYLLSGDADFVPAVASLRRRGKIVIGAGFADASTALIRECYHYIYLYESFIKEDLAAYLIFRTNGIAHQWLAGQVQRKADMSPSPINLRVYIANTRHEPTSLSVGFSANGPIELSDRRQQVYRLKTQLSVKIRAHGTDSFSVTFKSPVADGIKRKLKSFELSIQGLEITDNSDDTAFSRTYETVDQDNSDANKRDFVEPQAP